jgi:uncharacterized Zn finger protein
MFQDAGRSRPEGEISSQRPSLEGVSPDARTQRRERQGNRPLGNASGQPNGRLKPKSENGGERGAKNRKTQPRSKESNPGNQNRQGRFNESPNKQRANRFDTRRRPAGRPGLQGDEREISHAKTWWGDAWLSTLHRFGWKGRLLNGRIYATEGRVLNFNLEAGRIQARVQGTAAEPYAVSITVSTIPDTDWELIVEIMSCQALYTAQLLAGEMPQDVEEVFTAAYVPLFPAGQEELKAQCSCPDRANPCKHIAAVYYAMAEAFDKDPFLIFHLRGRSKDALLGMLRAQRSAEAQAFPLNAETQDSGTIDALRFWAAGEEIESIRIAIAPPALPGGTSKRLGRPPFWRSPADPITHLGELYEAIAKRARDLALGEPSNQAPTPLS